MIAVTKRVDDIDHRSTMHVCAGVCSIGWRSIDVALCILAETQALFKWEVNAVHAASEQLLAMRRQIV